MAKKIVTVHRTHQLPLGRAMRDVDGLRVIPYKKKVMRR
jgi:hypothetical protein